MDIGTPCALPDDLPPLWYRTGRVSPPHRLNFLSVRPRHDTATPYAGKQNR